jgi:hypothetical protein
MSSKRCCCLDGSGLARGWGRPLSLRRAVDRAVPAFSRCRLVLDHRCRGERNARATGALVQPGRRRMEEVGGGAGGRQGTEAQSSMSLHLIMARSIMDDIGVVA